MEWLQVRSAYPDQWLIIEALQAHSTADHHRQLDHIAVVETCPDGSAAMTAYRQLHQRFPTRELYFVHTSREDLDIQERLWVGIRGEREA